MSFALRLGSLSNGLESIGMAIKNDTVDVVHGCILLFYQQVIATIYWQYKFFRKLL